MKDKEVELFIAGIVMDPDSNSPIVILKDESGDRCLPIWIGVNEATSIATSLKGLPVNRPMTHDLLQNCIDVLGGKVVKILIVDLDEHTFFANIEVAVGDVAYTIDSRPSDAIALAVRVSTPIYVLDSVLKQAEVKLVTVDPEDEGGPLVDDNITIESFGDDRRDFTTIDKDKWAQILAEMDPDDFKYKM